MTNKNKFRTQFNFVSTDKMNFEFLSTDNKVVQEDNIPLFVIVDRIRKGIPVFSSSYPVRYGDMDDIKIGRNCDLEDLPVIQQQCIDVANKLKNITSKQAKPAAGQQVIEDDAVGKK